MHPSSLATCVEHAPCASSALLCPPLLSSLFPHSLPSPSLTRAKWSSTAHLSVLCFRDRENVFRFWLIAQKNHLKLSPSRRGEGLRVPEWSENHLHTHTHKHTLTRKAIFQWKTTYAWYSRESTESRDSRMPMVNMTKLSSQVDCYEME